MSRAARWLFGLGVALAFAGLLSLLALTFLAHLPAQPDSVTGHVVQLDVPGATYYITEWQAWIAERMPFIGICIGLAGVVLRRLAEGRARRSGGQAR
jgi:hypothetical protein